MKELEHNIEPIAINNITNGNSRNHANRRNIPLLNLDRIRTHVVNVGMACRSLFINPTDYAYSNGNKIRKAHDKAEYMLNNASGSLEKMHANALTAILNDEQGSIQFQAAQLSDRLCKKIPLVLQEKDLGNQDEIEAAVALLNEDQYAAITAEHQPDIDRIAQEFWQLIEKEWSQVHQDYRTSNGIAQAMCIVEDVANKLIGELRRSAIKTTNGKKEVQIAHCSMLNVLQNMVIHFITERLRENESITTDALKTIREMKKFEGHRAANRTLSEDGMLVHSAVNKLGYAIATKSIVSRERYQQGKELTDAFTVSTTKQAPRLKEIGMGKVDLHLYVENSGKNTCLQYRVDSQEGTMRISVAFEHDTHISLAFGMEESGAPFHSQKDYMHPSFSEADRKYEQTARYLEQTLKAHLHAVSKKFPNVQSQNQFWGEYTLIDTETGIYIIADKEHELSIIAATEGNVVQSTDIEEMKTFAAHYTKIYDPTQHSMIQIADKTVKQEEEKSEQELDNTAPEPPSESEMTKAKLRNQFRNGIKWREFTQLIDTYEKRTGVTFSYRQPGRGGSHYIIETHMGDKKIGSWSVLPRIHNSSETFHPNLMITALEELGILHNFYTVVWGEEE